jgi:lauroyl/myristoyl acyltransferase
MIQIGFMKKPKRKPKNPVLNALLEQHRQLYDLALVKQAQGDFDASAPAIRQIINALLTTMRFVLQNEIK